MRPFVVLTSNNAREMTDALKRRCLHLFIGYPDAGARAGDRADAQVPEAPARWPRRWCAVVQRVRELDLKKRPSVSETLDWARALAILNAQTLDRDLVESTLTLLVKHEKDLERVKGALDKVLADLG